MTRQSFPPALVALAGVLAVAIAMSMMAVPVSVLLGLTRAV